MVQFVRFSGCVFILFFSLSASAIHTIQSEFEGPVYVKAWEHWQASWNVERDLGLMPIFKIVRGWDGTRTPTLVFEWLMAAPGDKARLVCEGKRKKGDWEYESYRAEFSLSKVNLQASKYFLFTGEGCVDSAGKSVTERISVEVIRQGEVVFGYSVVPMYVRGRQTFGYNKVPAYDAHAGSGTIHVATEISDGARDSWDGVLVEPVVRFLDSTALEKGSIVGLHRHVENQEIYWADQGVIRVQNGVAGVVDGPYRNVRMWNPEKREFREVNEVRAEGGWMETRILEHGEKAIVVPNSQKRNVIYFHGVEALSDCAFWTAGSRN